MQPCFLSVTTSRYVFGPRKYGVSLALRNQNILCVYINQNGSFQSIFHNCHDFDVTKAYVATSD